MLQLLFIRHGESTGNREQRMAGHSDDGLTPAGQQQCQRLAHHLYQQEWHPSHVYTSPLRRAVESLAFLLTPWGGPPSLEQLKTEQLKTEQLKAIATKAGKFSWASPALPDSHPHASLQIIVSELLTEFQAGVLTGLTWSEAQRQYPSLCHELETFPEWVAIPGAETPLQGRNRAHQFVQQLLAEHSAGDAVWIVSHHWIMEHLIACLMGCDRTWQIPMPNTAVFEFWIDRDRWSRTGMARGISNHWQIRRFCDSEHLEVPVGESADQWSPEQNKG